MASNSAKPFDRSGADQVIENVAHKVPDVADQARQFAELAMDLPHEMSPTMGDLLAVSPASDGEIACLTPDVADPEPHRDAPGRRPCDRRPCNVGINHTLLRPGLCVTRFTSGAIFLKSFATAFLGRVVQAEQLLYDQIAGALDAEHIGAGVANRPDH